MNELNEYNASIEFNELTELYDVIHDETNEIVASYPDYLSAECHIVGFSPDDDL